MPSTSRRGRLPAPLGLYDPQNEHDACGVGFVAHLRGDKSHDIVETALGVLCNLAHRGATGADPETGDGAGIVVQLPHRFLQTACARQGLVLPAEGEYGVGMLFLPQSGEEQRAYIEVFERTATASGVTVLGWRDVPVESGSIGRIARDAEPVIRQVFVARPGGCALDIDFDRRLYVLRRRVENTIASMAMEEGGAFYIASLSCRTLVYKGLLMASQLGRYFADLSHPDFVSGLALVHQRFSTNTFPTWDLAHPFRYLAHNGEINTLRGNRNWMRARQAQMASDLFGDDLHDLFPILNEEGSDSATLDNAFELLMLGGRSPAHAMMMLIPEAWSGDPQMDTAKRGFYEYHACKMEPWDGPAAVAFTDGTLIGAVLDRNGLRPARYLVTDTDLVVMASETGVVTVDPASVRHKGRLQPGKLFLVDTSQGRIISDEEIKESVCSQQPYGEWVRDFTVTLDSLPTGTAPAPRDEAPLLDRQKMFGYTLEDIRIILYPMAANGEQPLGSMGTDTPIAVLSRRPQLLYNYFKQLFAQVTNPPIDPIREELVTSLIDYIGREGNLFSELPEDARQIRLESPILTNRELDLLRTNASPDFQSVTLPVHFPVNGGPNALESALQALCAQASAAVASGAAVIILSDRGADRNRAPIPTLLAVSAVHYHLVREGTRTQVALVAESGEAREVMHFCLLVGYGASAINPYLAFETLEDMAVQAILPADLTPEKAAYNYVKSINKGLIKTFAKMGISTLQSYRGAQIFEAIGLREDVAARYFTGTPSRLSGVGLETIQAEALDRHTFAYPPQHIAESLDLDPGGQYQWRRFGEYHQYNPDTISKLQLATRTGSYATFKEFSAAVNDVSEHIATLRGLLAFRPSEAVPIDEVEPVETILTRFVTGAMSLGSISREAHETLAIAMNRIGGKSNTGEGGEDPVRYDLDSNGDSRRSAIKQIASARFGVTCHYLVNADELQIKMAQGAKPGEGGELPGHKVDKYIASIRNSTPGVTLISPPPHHDIYSIEDLAQLIFDLKNVNPRARISVKLVAEVGVGTVAAGVSKAHADHVLISGYDGGTGASPVSSIKHAGIPWEMGLAETQQTLVKNDLRGRIRVQTDGQLKTGRDVAVAALLGAEEFGFSSAPLTTLGCVMMRVCHLNTCPVGIATQDPELRSRFTGKAEYVVNYFRFVAQELREIMAELGFRTVDEMVGRMDKLDPTRAVAHWKAEGLDLAPLLQAQDVSEGVATRCIQPQDHGLESSVDNELLELAADALNDGTPVMIEREIYNRHRTVGAMLSGEVARRWGTQGLPDDTIRLRFAGSAGQSFGAFLAHGITMLLEGDANDYVGKGLSGGRIAVFPPRESPFDPAENIIVGNTLLYGATSGQVFLRGVAGERFAVRNSGADAVVEGTGDHGCEYMTGGTVVVLGETGRNFAAGMSGGVAYVWDPDGTFANRCNRNGGLTVLEPVTDAEDITVLRSLIEQHQAMTLSDRAATLLQSWEQSAAQFVKVVSLEFRRAQQDLAAEDAALAAAAKEHPAHG